MKLYVYPTDRGWFNFLRSRPDLDEVNFWRPGGQLNFRGLEPGELLLFRLKAPVNRIAGGGIFVHSSLFPIRATWSAFGEKNGTPNEQAFFERIAGFRNIPVEQLDLESTVGCILLQSPFFLPEDLWLEVPAELSLNQQQGGSLDATTGPGKRLIDAVTSILSSLTARGVAEAKVEGAAMFGDPVLTRRRLGQGSFRLVIADTYSRRCAVTGERTFPVLEAAHIHAVRRGGRHRTDNGMLLRSDIHRLFDLGYVTVTPDCRFDVSQSLREDFSNGKVYYDLVGRSIRLPSDPADHPGKPFLEQHRDLIFRR